MLDTTKGKGGIDPVTGEVFLLLDASGKPIVAKDPKIIGSKEGAECSSNGSCHDLNDMKSVIDFMYQAGVAYRIPMDNSPKGTY